MSSLSLSTLLSAASVLTGAESKTKQSPTIATVLKSRLVRVFGMLDRELDELEYYTDLAMLQYITAEISLDIVERVQAILDPVDSDDSPPLGARDLSQIRTLLSIIFKWVIRPLSTELELHDSGSGTPVPERRQIIDLTEKRPQSEELPSLVLRLLHLIFAPAISGKIRQTWITTSIINYHAEDMLTPCLLLGWSSTASADSRFTEIKSLSGRFVNILRPHQAITALGAILSSVPKHRPHTEHVSKACSLLLSNQLRRPDGVRGLCLAVLGEHPEDGDALPLEKLEHIARVLRTVPSSTKPEDYFQFMIPRILELLFSASSEQTHHSHKRAAAFTLSRMISPKFRHNATASAALLPILHGPFLSIISTEDDMLLQSQDTRRLRLSPVEALNTLQALLLHTDPSPTEVSTLLTPIVPELYTLLNIHRSSKTVDPAVRESLNSLLNTWGRIVSSADVIAGLCSIISGAGGEWEFNAEGFKRSSNPSAGPSISLLTAAELERSSERDVDIHTNPFNLRPDPVAFVGFLKSLERQEVASDMFVRFLNRYQNFKEAESDPMHTLLYLQLILQMQSQLSATILSKPEHILSFIKHALVSESLRPSLRTRKSDQRNGLGLEDLLIVDKDLLIVDKDESDEGDSDDENEDNQNEHDVNRGGKDEISLTAVSLLLSILGENSDLSPRTTPDLMEILNSLDKLTSHTSPNVRQLAREARIVLTARTASTSATSSASAPRPEKEAQSVQETYQKALKLLQDPMIPVRAHGLQLLRDLVSTRGRVAKGSTEKKPLLDPALVPGILSIFIQSIQDDDSYLFLNAVQGLAAMVDGYGREVLRGVMEAYLLGTGIGGNGGSGNMSKEEMDARLRVGEALNAAVKRCGSTLSFYVDILVPPLLTILRSSQFPTTLRASALSILAQCMKTHTPSLTAYIAGLMNACIDLVQLESVAAKSSTAKRDIRDTSPGEKVKDGTNGGVQGSSWEPEPTDLNPVTNDAKVAPFRRSAIHFLSHLLRAQIVMNYDSRKTTIPHVTVNIDGSRLQSGSLPDRVIPESTLKQAGIVLGYVAATDEDGVSRAMAREALDFVKQYREALLGY